MSEMEIDSDVLASNFSGFEPGARRPSREVDKPVNGLVITSTEVPEQENSEMAGAVGLVSPAYHHDLVTQDSRMQSHLKRDTSEFNQDVGTRFESAPAPVVNPSSEDELLEGEIAWSMPIIQPKLLATGLCYDVRMRYHYELEPPKQRLDFHPEDPRRIYHIYRELCQAGLYKDPQFNVPIIDKPLERIQARSATAPEICLVHSAAHYHFVESTAGVLDANLFRVQHTDNDLATSDEELVRLERQYDSVYFNRLTFSSALLSAGGAIETCKAVVIGKVKNAIAVIRPPGHHAECNRPMGFCLFDNVSIATKVCQADFPDICRKVLILDW